MKTKIRLVAHTPLGTFYSNWNDDNKKKREEFKQFMQDNASDLKYLTLESGSSKEYIIMKQALQNSVIEIERKMLQE